MKDQYQKLAEELKACIKDEAKDSFNSTNSTISYSDYINIFSAGSVNIINSMIRNHIISCSDLSYFLAKKKYDTDD